VAVAGVTEAPEIYLKPRLRGAEVDGADVVVGLRADGGGHNWAVRRWASVRRSRWTALDVRRLSSR